MKFKKVGFFIVLFSLITFFGNITFSLDLNLEDFLSIYFEGVSKYTEDIGSGRQNIKVKYNNVYQNTQLYEALQKGIYLGLFPNASISLPVKEVVTQDIAVKLIQLENDKHFSYTKGEPLSAEWTLDLIKQTIQGNNIQEQIKYNIIEEMKNNYLYKDEIDRTNLKCTSITGCAEMWKDDYTEYMEQKDADLLMEELEGSFEGIGAYIHMVYSGIFVIGSTIKGGPAESAGLKSGDIILQVDGNIINIKTSISDLTNRIKGNSGTYLTLKVRRGNEDLYFKIERGHIVLPNITYQKLTGNMCYMKIEQFNNQTLQQFKVGLTFFQNRNCQTYIFDLRDNPGGELDVVTHMLNYFVDDGDVILEMRYINFLQYIMADDSTQKIKGKDILLLINGSTASASEIFVGVLHDYMANSKIIGSNSFGKGSAQSLIQYVDGSILKYTVAKRYTGKSKTNIDGVGLEPDAKISDEKIDSFLEMLGLK